jgi:hypothetical protein
VDDASGSHGSGVGVVERGPFSPPPVAPCVCCSPFDDTSLEEGLDEDADLLFTVPAQVPFWTSGQFEPLIVAVILPLSHVPRPRYTGPWVVKGTDKGEQTTLTLRHGFKMGEQDDTGEFHELDGILRKVWKDPESGSRVVLQQFLAWVSNFPPVQKCLVRGMLSGGKRQQVSEIRRSE